MRKIVEVLIRFRRTVIIAMAVITAFFIVAMFRIDMYTVFLDLFPQNHPYVKVHQQHAKYFGGAYMATIVLETKNGDVWNVDTLKKIERITEAVDLIPGVVHFGIYSLSSNKATMVRETPTGIAAEQIMKHPPTDQAGIEALKKKVFTSTVNGTMVSLDQKSLRLDAQFIEGRIDFTELFDKFMEIKKKEEDGNHKIYLSGQPILYGWIYHYLPNMILILVLTSAAILLMLYAYMGQGGLWWWPFIGAALCSIWGLGFAAILGFHFDPLIIVIPFLLSTRAMSHGVQWVERFTEEYQKTGDIREAALITGTGLFPPGLIGIVADTWALLIIAITPIPTLRNLAFLGTFWAGACIFTILVLFPPLFASFKTVRVPRKSDVPRTLGYKVEYLTEHVLRRILVRLSSWTFGKGRYITVGIAVVVLLVSIVSSFQLKFGDANPGSPILWPKSEYNTDIVAINNRFPGVDQMWVAVVARPEETVTDTDVMKGMESLGRYMMEDPNVGYAVSIADVIKSINMLAYGNDPKYETLPGDKRIIDSALFLFANSTTTGELDPWIDPQYEVSNVKFYLKNHEGPLLDEVINRIKTFLANNPNLMKNARIELAGGLGGILSAANQVIRERNDPILLFILVVIFIHCSLTYKSILAGVIFTISLVLANFLAFTYMVVKGIGLNINTFPVVSLGIGMGVDYGLYIVSRIIEIYREQEVKDLGEAVKGGIITAGRAVFFTATMMSAGVVLWVFSPLRFQAEMGLLLGILMMVNMIVGVLVLPAVINIIRPRFIIGKDTAGRGDSATRG